MADRAVTTVRLVAGDGLVARRSNELLFCPSANPAIVAAFDGAPPGQVIEAVTALVEADAETAGEAVGDFVAVQWSDRLRVAVFGAVEVTSDHRSLPRLSASGAGTWIERSIAADQRIVLRCGVGAVMETTSLVAGTVTAGGFELRFETSPALASSAPSTPALVPAADPVTADPPGPIGNARRRANAFAALSESDDDTIPPDTIDPDTIPPDPIDPDPIDPDPIDPDPIDGRAVEAPVVPPDVKVSVEPASRPVAVSTGRTGRMSACPSCLAPVPTGAGVCSACGHQLVNLDNRAGDNRAGDNRAGDNRAGDHRAGDHRAGDQAAWQIVFADGRVEPVDRTLVLGRDPHPDDDAARPVTLDCELVSATHLEVRAVGAELHLVDLGSRNNTFVLTTGDAQFVPIEPGRPHRVGDGTVVQLGSRRFTVVRIEGGAAVGSTGTSLGNAPQ